MILAFDGHFSLRCHGLASWPDVGRQLDVNGQMSADGNGRQRTGMDISGCEWMSIDINGHHRTSIDFPIARKSKPPNSWELQCVE